MDLLGYMFIFFGGALAFVSAISLAFLKEEGNEVSSWQLIDVFLIGGVISFALELARGISDVFYDRSSTSFIFTVSFFVSMGSVFLGVGMVR